MTPPLTSTLPLSEGEVLGTVVVVLEDDVAGVLEDRLLVVAELSVVGVAVEVFGVVVLPEELPPVPGVDVVPNLK
jgi:hypothetical protein